MNIRQKLYYKTHLNAVLALIFFFNILYSDVVISHKMLYSCSMSSLSYAKDSFSKMKLVKRTYVLSYNKLTWKINFIFQQKVFISFLHELATFQLLVTIFICKF